jgi:hypothetical protein
MQLEKKIMDRFDILETKIMDCFHKLSEEIKTIKSQLSNQITINGDDICDSFNILKECKNIIDSFQNKDKDHGHDDSDEECDNCHTAKWKADYYNIKDQM